MPDIHTHTLPIPAGYKLQLRRFYLPPPTATSRSSIPMDPRHPGYWDSGFNPEYYVDPDSTYQTTPLDLPLVWPTPCAAEWDLGPGGGSPAIDAYPVGASLSQPQVSPAITSGVEVFA